MRFSPGKIHEDVLWSCELAKSLNDGVIETEKKIYCYRQREDGIVGKGHLKLSPDFIYAGEQLIELVDNRFPSLKEVCLKYAVEYPWSFVDRIYVNRNFDENKELLNSLQWILRKYKEDYKELECFKPIIKNRMKLFARSRFLYGFNAYSRLLRMYICKLLHIDPYKGEHWI